MSLEPPRPAESDRLLRWWTWIFIAVGVLLRLERYALKMPIWGDEAFIGLNIVRRGYQKLLTPLDDFQVAPLGFLFSQRFAFEMLGMSEYAMRLFPMLAGILALILFAIWARLMTPGRPALISIAIMAVGIYSVRHAVELKPYGYDLCAAMFLLLPVTLYLQHQKLRWLSILVVLTPIALIMSFPAVFVAGGVTLALAFSLRKPKPFRLTLFAVYIMVVFTGFWFFDYKVAEIQFPQNSTLLTNYWQDAFPPSKPLEFTIWLISTHTGNMSDYPFGGRNGTSAPNFVLFLLGIYALARLRNRPLLILLLSPFALTFIAALMHRYPYGGSARVSQQLAPAIILLMGLGISWLIDRAKNPTAQFYLSGSVVIALLCIGTALGIFMKMHPYQTSADAEVRQLVQDTLSRAGPDTNIAILQRPTEIGVTYQWYLIASRRQLIWNGASNYIWIRFPNPVMVIATKPMADLEEDLHHNLGREPIYHDFRKLNFREVLQAGPDQWEVFLFPAESDAQQN